MPEHPADKARRALKQAGWTDIRKDGISRGDGETGYYYEARDKDGDYEIGAWTAPDGVLESYRSKRAPGTPDETTTPINPAPKGGRVPTVGEVANEMDRY